MKFLYLLFLCFSFNNLSFCNEIYIAVASNFLVTLQKISYEFEKRYECKIIISSDSSANLFNKIKLGINFDIFFSADSFYPKLLESENRKSFVYAFGKIVFFKKNFIIKKNFLFLIKKFKCISLANSNLSPYGYAGISMFNNIKINNNLFVYSSNINHSFNFIYFGLCDGGIVALSHIIQNNIEKHFIWKIPKYLYKEIEQRFIVLNYNKNYNLSVFFLNYIKSKEIKLFIESQGYKIANE